MANGNMNHPLRMRENTLQAYVSFTKPTKQTYQYCLPHSPCHASQIFVSSLWSPPWYPTLPWGTASRKYPTSKWCWTTSTWPTLPWSPTSPLPLSYKWQIYYANFDLDLWSWSWSRSCFKRWSFSWQRSRSLVVIWSLI